MPRLARDLRFAFRQLRNAPGFTMTVILTLALGIGATTAIFSIVEGVLLRPLPFEDPERLVQVGDHLGNSRGTGVTAREIGTYASAGQAFSSMGGFTTATFDVPGDQGPEEINAARLKADVFPTLGVQPALGRVFTAQEEDARQPLTVISYALWMNRFNRDPNILGKQIVLDGKPHSIIGVMPRSFEFPLQAGHLNRVQLWVPMSLTAEELSVGNTGVWGYQIVARLKDGFSPAQAALDADRVAQQVMREFPENMAAIHIRGDVTPLRELVVAGVRPLLRGLFVAVAIVLLIACVNVAGLLLVRAIRRRREYAVRLALGARASAILRESVLEGVVLSLAGGLLGLGFAAAAVRTALHLLPETMPRIDSISIDIRVVLCALVLALASGALCSLAPGFAALRTNLIESLKDGARSGSGGASHAWLRSALVVTEIAIALVMLTVAGAFLRSFQKMLAVDPGFKPDHVLVAGYQLPLSEYATNSSVTAFNRSITGRLARQPGVLAVGISNVLPASGSYAAAAYTIEGVPAERWKLQFASFAITDGDYFRAMGIPLLDGRTFTEADRSDTPLVVLVNQSMAKHCWPGQRPIGKRMHVGNPKKGLPWATVVGVVADTSPDSRDKPVGDQWYTPANQPATLFGAENSGNSGALTRPVDGYITLRSTVPPEQMSKALRSTVAAIDPLLALEEIQTMDEVISTVEAPRRFNTDLITAFALGALLLAITGIYAVVAFSVSLRSQEIAIRMALGAQRGRIVRLVLISGAKIALIGCGLGMLGSLAISRLVSSFLFDVSLTDPLFYAGAALTMILMALLASALPAIRAASIDPIVALRTV